MPDSEFAPLFPVLSVRHGAFWGRDIDREPPSIFSIIHWYLSQLILSARCEMIHWANSSNADPEPNGQRNSEYLRLDDASGETIL
jgi:hypothetical protein